MNCLQRYVEKIVCKINSERDSKNLYKETTLTKVNLSSHISLFFLMAREICEGSQR